MKYMRYSAPVTMAAALEEADLIAGSFSDGEPIIGPASMPTPEEGLFFYD